MQKIFFTVYTFIIILTFFVAPHFVLAADDPGGSGYFLLDFECTGKEILGANGEKECNFKDFMGLLNRFITLLLYIAVLLAVISFVYAGFRLIFSGGNEDAIKHAKHIFLNVLVGLVLAYGAWLIIHFIVITLGVKDGYDLLR